MSSSICSWQADSGVRVAVALMLALGACALAPADDSLGPERSDAPIERISPKEPQAALQTFSVLDGFSMELIAQEPLLRDPVAIAYDEDGAMFAVEMTAYPHPERAEEVALGSVRRLIDRDGDGRFDESFLFADKLSTPTSVICWRGGVFVAAPPDIWFLKDTDGDHRADIRRQVFTGFGVNNAEQLANNLVWGIDNKIYGATSHSGGEIIAGRSPLDTEQESREPVSINGRDFRFDPVTGEFESLSWANSRWGNTFDDGYRRFVCQNTGPARHVVLPGYFVSRNPYLRVDRVFQSLAKEGGEEPVFRTSPPEPWRVVRARRRQALGKPANPGEINPVGYFTSSCGITVYRGHAYPAEYRGNLFVGEVAGNLVHRRELRQQGATFSSQRADPGREFVSSSDNFFRPVNFVNAPDGTLHVVDMYREVVEGPSWVPEDLKQAGLVDVHGASNRGRIYRLSPPQFRLPPRPQLGKASSKVLLEHLRHPSSWWRETAQRLLVERQDSAVVPALRDLIATGAASPAATTSDGPAEVLALSRLHALGTLAGLGALRDEDLALALQDSSEVVREHAVRWAEPRLNDVPPLLDLLCRLHADESPRVRFQAAFVLGTADDERVPELLARICQSDLDDLWTRTAVLSSSNGRADRLLDRLLAIPSIVRSLEGQTLLAELSFMVGARNQRTEVERAVATIRSIRSSNSSRELQAKLVVALLDGRGGVRQFVRLSAPMRTLIIDLLPHARETAARRDAPPQLRATAISLLAFDEWSTTAKALEPLFDARQPPAVQLAALRTLTRYPKLEVATMLVDGWKGFTPALRSAALEALFARTDWSNAALDAMQRGEIPVGEISAPRRELLLGHKDAVLRGKATALLEMSTSGPRQAVIAEYQPSLELPGRSAQGKAVFLRDCVACHRFGERGNDVGPNLSAYGRKKSSREAILTHILDPNREVSSQFVAYIIVLNDGRILTGAIAAQSPTSLTLAREQGEQVTILRRDIDEIRSTGKSLMPEGFEKKINQQEMADLLEFLLAVTQRI